MIDTKKATQILEKHFAQLSTEEFIKNLKQSCPEIFENEQKQENIISFPAKTKQKSNSHSNHF